MGNSSTLSLPVLLSQYGSLLDRFRFDAKLFTSLQARVRSHGLSATDNLCYPLPEPLPEQFVVKYADLCADEANAELGLQALRDGQIAYLVLNGGMATRFDGLVKGVVDVFSGKSFLQIKLELAAAAERDYGAKVHFVTMNSFQTEEPTLAYFRDHGSPLPEERMHFFNQSIQIRMDEAGDIFQLADGTPSFYAPGHGDFQEMLVLSGLFATLREAGVKHLVFSNIDNLLAKIDPAILGYHIREGKDYTAEVVDNTAGDVGGSPVIYQGKSQIVEGLRFPSDFPPQHLKYLATNTFVFRLDGLQWPFPLRRYLTSKQVEGRTALQFERITNELTAFLKGNFLLVDRGGEHGRFIPIKSRQDLEQQRGTLQELLSPLLA